jgi:hypothetical protein
MKIAVAGTGYAGLSIATLLAQDNEVHAISTTEAKASRSSSMNRRWRTKAIFSAARSLATWLRSNASPTSLSPIGMIPCWMTLKTMSIHGTSSAGIDHIRTKDFLQAKPPESMVAGKTDHFANQSPVKYALPIRTKASMTSQARAPNTMFCCFKRSLTSS